MYISFCTESYIIIYNNLSITALRLSLEVRTSPGYMMRVPWPLVNITKCRLDERICEYCVHVHKTGQRHQLLFSEQYYGKTKRGQPDRQTTGFISFCSRLSRQQSRNINKHWAAARSLTTRLLARSLGGARLSAALSIAATNVIDSCEAKQQWKVRAVYYWHCIRGRSRILAFGLQRYMTSNINFAKR